MLLRVIGRRVRGGMMRQCVIVVMTTFVFWAALHKATGWVLTVVLCVRESREPAKCGRAVVGDVWQCLELHRCTSLQKGGRASDCVFVTCTWRSCARMRLYLSLFLPEVITSVRTSVRKCSYMCAA
jgi:hypothetical protein